MKPHLVVMVKAPCAGRVKTRLGREIGMTNAAWWFRHQTRALLRRIEDPRWQITLAVAPDRAAVHGRAWPAHMARKPQGRGDLGARMGRMLRQMPLGPVVVIGADIPDISNATLAPAFTALRSKDAVLGPATDGGYWLIGLARRRAIPSGLFRGVRWSTPHAMSDTVATLPDHRCAYVATLRDVDTIADLHALKR